MIDISDARSSLSVLREWLLVNDFRATDASPGQVTGDDYAEWLSGTLRVEIKDDRGQTFLGIGLVAMVNTFHPNEWESWLDGVPLPPHLSDLDHQVAFITQRWLRAARRAATDVVATEDALEAIGLDWLERRFGWRPGRLHEAR